MQHRIPVSRLVGLTLLLIATVAGRPGELLGSETGSSGPVRPPNLIFIMADDLGYGDLGCYGQTLIRTPNLDRMAKEGMKFRQFYAGNTVCAPSRAVLMTGLHMGHVHVRGNAGGDMSIQSLRAQDLTVAELLKDGGYKTCLCGKWGLGDDLDGARVGLPNKKGFDHFFGYLNQVHAHNYYPEFLWRNNEKVALRNEVEKVGNGYGGFPGGYATRRLDYSHDLVLEEAKTFIDEHKQDPFFLYLSLTIPHANNEGTRGTGNGQEVPSLEPYQDEQWSEQDKGQAAMITRMDQGVGQILEQLKALGIAEETLVIFTSDNGPHDEGGHDTERFTPAGPLRGMKRDLYEGGIRVPMIAWWPGTIRPDQISDHVSYFGDLMATAADLSGQEVPDGLDSISFLPTLTGEGPQQEHDYLYWEFYEQGGKKATRFGNWKAVKIGQQPIELYDLSEDLGEAQDLASQEPEIVEHAEEILQEAHVEHPNWQFRGRAPKSPPPGDGRARF